MAGRVKLICVCLVSVLAGIGLTSWAAPATPPTFTGCLVSGTGEINKVKRGSNPLAACGSGETRIRISSGDITEITTAPGSGLMGGAPFGVASLAVDFGVLDDRYVPASPATRGCFDITPIERVDISYCHMPGIDWSGATLISADLRFADLTGARLDGAVLSNADLSGATLRFADLRNAFMPNANLSNVNLYGSLMDGANITGVTWLNTICPDGALSNAIGGTCAGHLSPTTP